MVQSRDQESSGDPDRFLRVVMLHLAPIGQQTIGLREDDDQVRSGFQERLVLVRAQGRQRIKPFLRGFVVVELVFFLLRGLANLCLQCRVADDHEVPRLKVSAVRRRPGRAQAIFDNFSGNRAL